MILELLTLVLGILAMATIVGLTGGLHRTFGGLIGEPTREIIVEPKNEPVPMTAPLPAVEPAPETVQQRGT